MTRSQRFVCAIVAGLVLNLCNGLYCSASRAFHQASQHREFQFPADHADHPGFQTEWWYYTGNLVSEKGRPFGYQLTFFRVQLKPGPFRAGSPWRTNQLYFAHFTVSDIEKGRFLTAEKTGRGAMGMGGVSSDAGNVCIFLHSWESVIQGRSHRLRGDGDGFSIALELISQKPPVLHGSGGLSRKGAGPGQASYYYTLTRMNSRGVVTLKNEQFVVSGSSWMDHEFSSNVLSKEQVGWDWMGLQLSGNRELMLYALRREDGSIDPFSSGTLINPDGTSVHLPKEAFVMRPQDHWRSEKTGIRYPSGWHVEVFPHGLSLHVTPNLKNQELVTSQSTQVTYWEGSVAVTGSAEGEAMSGWGYVELTGYGGAFELSFD